jgi:hypothetical protein
LKLAHIELAPVETVGLAVHTPLLSVQVELGPVGTVQTKAVTVPEGGLEHTDAGLQVTFWSMAQAWFAVQKGFCGDATN